MTAPNITFDALFDPEFLARVQQFALSVSQVDKGGRLAEQASNARGQGSDFADFRPYIPGDDLRAIDWNIYRRLGRLFVRVFEERQDMPVYFLIDSSASMATGETPRLHAALRASLAIAAIALGQHDSVTLMPFADAMAIQARQISGKGNLVRVARHLADTVPEGGTALARSVEALAALRMRRGLAVIVSDFFDPDGLAPVLDALALVPHQLILVQLVRPEDADPTRNPACTGDVLIEDSETGVQVELSITPELMTRYQNAYGAFTRDLLAFATTRPAPLIQLDASRDVLDQLAILFEGGTLTL